MLEVMLPMGAIKIISRLNERGHRADVVGGSVRDAVRGVGAADFDITTDARPEELLEIFSDYKTVETGIKHGTLTVLVDSVPYEVTTYRVDGEYTDGRHPDSVEFTKELTLDLSRRDFTMNAVAYNPRDGFTDPYGGISDIRKKVIRAVGDPMRRFSEDALRILRGIRFSATLGFRIEKRTSEALIEERELLKNVSAERIFTEWKKLLGGESAYRVIKEYKSVIDVFIPELCGVPLPDPDAFLDLTSELREISLFAMAEKNDAQDLYLSMSERLKVDNKRKEFAASVLKNIMRDIRGEKAKKLLILDIGRDASVALVKVKAAIGDIPKNEIREIEEITETDTVFSLRDLAVDGREIAALGYSGRVIGEILGKALRSVCLGEVANEKEKIIEFVTEKIKK